MINMSVMYGWQNEQWRKQPLNIGYSNALLKHNDTGALSAGTNNILLDVVPTNEIWSVLTLMCYVNSTTINYLYIHNAITSSFYNIDGVSNPTKNVWLPLASNFLLHPGRGIGVLVTNATVNDIVHLEYTGYVTEIVD